MGEGRGVGDSCGELQQKTACRLHRFNTVVYLLRNRQKTAVGAILTLLRENGLRYLWERWELEREMMENGRFTSKATKEKSNTTKTITS